MDLLEILKKGYLFVVVDYYLKWLEIVFLIKIDVGIVIKCLESMFCIYGLFEVFRSDNGLLFVLWEFEGFFEYLVIDYKKGILYWF